MKKYKYNKYIENQQKKTQVILHNISYINMAKLS